jgi:hypothetical protein
MRLMKRFSMAACAVVLTGLAAPTLSIAESGFAAMHDMRREGRRVCFSDHYHYGTSFGKPTRRAAEAAAVQSWADFVDFEYGGTWNNFTKASGKGMSCGQSSTGWGCDLSARPCK